MADSSIPVKVAARIRPLSKKETSAGCQDCLEVYPGRPQIVIRKTERSFTYDYAFGQNSQQEQVYDACVKPLVDKLFKGFNATVLAYGQTGSGKTYSMGTCTNEATPKEQEGVIPRAVDEIFSRIREMQDYVFSVRVAFVELYKEQLYDLLSTQVKKEDCLVDIREDPNIGVFIPNLSEVAVMDLQSTYKQLELGSLKRVTAATAMNNVSSRSHAIFTLALEGTKRDEEAEDTEESPRSILAKFHLVDLAGSERANKTKATGVRYKEGVAINLGLLALGGVISALCDEQKHIPYRESKLTRLLQDSLGGNAHTLMIACVSPADTNLEETICTLRYADRARKIKNKPIVNRDSKDQEIMNLRRELQDIKAKIANGEQVIIQSPGLTKAEKDELDSLKERYRITLQENSELTVALCACQEEMAFINEKLILAESSSENLKQKLSELQSEAASVMEKSEAKEDFQQIMNKIADVLNAHDAGEKSLLQHAVSRHECTDSSQISLEEGSNGTENDENETEDQMYDAAHALKSNALSNQLANLNKLLAQKEHLASTMMASEANVNALQKKYESEIKSMESELEVLSKEKDQLLQQIKSEPASKISEQRRKRIRELEQLIQDLRKKVVEQERIIKMNEKQAAKVKLLSDEIRSMKQQKVKLIKQMKEEAENVRIWKQRKEKEVIKLKQNERKQQCQMARMENLHQKQQNVLRRKMEEAIATNKRLKDLVTKQKAARKMNQPKPNDKQGWLGCAERVRKFVTEELDIAISVKEAVRVREQLLEDRKVLAKQLTDLKRKNRITMTSEDREKHEKHIAEVQQDLDSRNEQISELQKQIIDADQEKEKEGASNWMDSSLTSMTEAKVAIEYLFSKAAESMVSASSLSNEVNELKQLFEESAKNTANLEDEINQMKIYHAEAMDRAFKDYEERVMLLLSKLTNKDTEIKDSELQKFSRLHEELQKMIEEANEKKTTAKKAKKESAKSVVQFITEESEEDYSEDEESETDYEEDSDEEWTKTPLMKRIVSMRRVAKGTIKRKAEDDGEANETKRISGQGSGCTCKTGCKNNRCACKKSGQSCKESCKCLSAMCMNKDTSEKEDGHESLGLGTVRSSLDNTAGTMSLLNSTVDMSVLHNRTNQPNMVSSPETLKRPADDPNLDVENMSPKKSKKFFKSPVVGSP